MTKLPYLMAATFALTLSGCMPTQDETAWLTADEIKTALIDQSLRYSGRWDGHYFSGIMTAHEAGSLEFVVDSGLAEGGAWQLKGNAFCFQLAVFNAGQENCARIKARANGGYITENGFQITKREMGT